MACPQEGHQPSTCVPPALPADESRALHWRERQTVLGICQLFVFIKARCEPNSDFYINIVKFLTVSRCLFTYSKVFINHFSHPDAFN